MSRDYKNSGSAAPNGRGNPMGVGILIGLLLGLCIALGVALYINKGANPFVKKPRPAESVGRETPPAETTQTPPSHGWSVATASADQSLFGCNLITP